MKGYYYVLTIYDRKDFYAVKDPEQKKLLQQLTSDPEIQRIGPGRYRSKSPKLRSFASINENRRWRMEVVEKFEGKNVVYRDRWGDEPEQRACFTPIENRTWKTYFKDLARAYWSKLTLYCLFYFIVIAGCIIVSDDLLNPHRSDPFQKNSGPIELLFGIMVIPFTLFWSYVVFELILMPYNIFMAYKNMKPILIPLQDT